MNLCKLTMRSIFLKIATDDDKTTLLDRLFQASTTLLLKKYLRTYYEIWHEASRQAKMSGGHVLCRRVFYETNRRRLPRTYQ